MARRKRVSMRKLKEILRLKAAGISDRQIARSCNVARSTVWAYLRLVKKAQIAIPLPDDVNEEELERKLFPRSCGPGVKRPVADWQDVHRELSGRRKGVTLRLLWEEYRSAHPDGYLYSQFCELYRRWAKTLDVCMRQTHKAGEKMFVDYAGQTMDITDGATGEVRQAQIFVAALGASNYLYTEATPTQQLPDWIASHVRAYEYIGGVPEMTIPDNPKAGVSSACRYEPDLNPTYQDMARHYGTAVIPARAGKPRDKAKVEEGVQLVEREILAPLRHQKFFSAAELNRAIWARLKEVNRRPFQKLKGSRWELFEQLDKPALKPLPPQRYEYAEFRKARVNIDYHIEVARHYYSVPYQLKGEQLDVRLTAGTVEVLHKGRRVASHQRDDSNGKHSTQASHMPKAHRAYLEWTPSRIIHWAAAIGPSCAQAARMIMEGRDHPEQGYRSCLGLIRLSKSYGNSRLEAACRRAVAFELCSYRSIKSILDNNKDREMPDQQEFTFTCRRVHENVRGQLYYQKASVQ